MTESDIRKAYVRIREIDNTIPDEVLNFMRDCAIKQIKRMEEIRKIMEAGRKQLTSVYLKQTIK